jgi:hypothetical protein
MVVVVRIRDCLKLAAALGVLGSCSGRSQRCMWYVVCVGRGLILQRLLRVLQQEDVEPNRQIDQSPLAMILLVFNSKSTEVRARYDTQQLVHGCVAAIPSGS